MFGAFLPLVDTDSQLHNEILSLMIKYLPTYSATCFLYGVQCALCTLCVSELRYFFLVSRFSSSCSQKLQIYQLELNDG